MALAAIGREGALREAAVLDRQACDGSFSGALHGIPIGPKGVFYTGGMRTTG
jgi:Asp-tRNA(Asn)/Glu-tRNA(Gln) amidotransferase A subunit family amidase